MTRWYSFCLHLLVSRFAKLLCFLCFYSVATTAFSCRIILADPADDQKDVSVNHNITLVVEKKLSESCRVHVTTEKSKQEIPVTMAYSSPVVTAKDLSHQIVIVRPQSLLWAPHGHYRLRVDHQDGSIGFLTRSDVHDIEGRLSSVVDNPVQFSPWQHKQFLTASEIGNSLNIFLDLKMGQGNDSRLKSFLSKHLHLAVPSFSAAKSLYDVKVKKIYFYSALPKGRMEKFSALLVYPVGAQVDYKKIPIVLFESRSDSHYQPSSVDGYISWLGIVAASKGNVFISPDVWDSLPKSVSVDAYPFYYAKKNIDLIEATREYFLKTYSTVLGSKLIMVGNFDGGRDVINSLFLSHLLSYKLPEVVMSNSAAYDLSAYFSPALSCSSSHKPPHALLKGLYPIVLSYSLYWDLYSSLNYLWSGEKGLVFEEGNLCHQLSNDLLLVSPTHQSWLMRADKTEVYLYQHPYDDALPSANSLMLSSSLMNGGKFKFILHNPCEKKEFSSLMRAGAVTPHSVCGFFMLDDLMRMLSSSGG
ncbi:hypothetical protein [Candidatus Ichthyocystis hellenicum]|uniref:hypothetical protein n=1 Tax=Candidatus Ichthyocystis hellenicum TaxID=1561003 RepID=UPI000B844EBB|nr:hypothetical protein [Candidatus Ichthyocystis hellenicum]